jgi:twitching motility protein PilT
MVDETTPQPAPQKPAWEIPVLEDAAPKFAQEIPMGSGLTPGYVPPGYVDPFAAAVAQAAAAQAAAAPAAPVAPEPVPVPVPVLDDRPFDLGSMPPAAMTFPGSAAPQQVSDAPTFAPPPAPPAPPVASVPPVVAAPPASAPAFADLPAPAYEAPAPAPAQSHVNAAPATPSPLAAPLPGVPFVTAPPSAQIAAAPQAVAPAPAPAPAPVLAPTPVAGPAHMAGQQAPFAGLPAPTVPAPSAPPAAPVAAPTDLMRADSVIADGDIISALEQVLFTGASDLHVTASSIPMLRIDGKLRPVTGASLWSAEDVEKAIRGLMTEEQLEVFDKTHEMDFAYALPGGTRFRANCYQQRGATGAAFRIISTSIRNLDELGLPPTVAQFATLPRGLVLVTGPTGSGKSTTLAALIDLVNRTRYDHIVTVEDPIEYVHQNKKSLINQREVGADTLSFTAALKHVLRQDPDVILIGEMRDLETISVALTAAETGHLVFATLHTQDAAQTIDRIIDVYPSHQQDQIRTQLAATLQGVVSQTLVPRASGAGRVIATEVLITTPAVANLIREGKAHQITSAMQAGRALGMHTMDQHLADLVNEGEITREAAIEKAHDLDSLERLVRRVEPTAQQNMTLDESHFAVSDLRNNN